MDTFFVEYINEIGQNIPSFFYLGLTATLFLSFFISCAFLGLRRCYRILFILLFISYVCLIFADTIIYRDTLEQKQFCFIPFWSYVEMTKGLDPYMFPQILMNILAFMPLGFLFGVFEFLVGQKKMGVTVIFVGLIISSIIELLQFIYCLGCSEIDDIIHNTLGCFLGYILYVYVKKRAYSMI